jgi:hypothetical protein
MSEWESWAKQECSPLDRNDSASVISYQVTSYGRHSVQVVLDLQRSTGMDRRHVMYPFAKVRHK